MRKVDSVNSFDKLKLLADSRRLDILRLLMASPATITQLARTLKRSPAWIRHHILSLESANLVEVSEVRKTGKVTEKYYRAKADALLLQQIVLPNTRMPALIFSGSHDLARDFEPQSTVTGLPVFVSLTSDAGWVNFEYSNVFVWAFVRITSLSLLPSNR